MTPHAGATLRMTAHDPKDVQILGASVATRNRKNTDARPSNTRSRDRVQFSHRALQNSGTPESQPAQASQPLSPPKVVKLGPTQHSPSTTSPTTSISSPGNGTFCLESQDPPHLFTAEGVTLTLAEDYLTAKNREGTWRCELARDVCAALRCNPSRFQYVGMRSGSILASFNLLPVAPGDADKRSARNLASELALQVYDVSSLLRTSPTTAKAIDVTLHPPAQASQRLSPPQVVKLGPTQQLPSTTSPSKSISSPSNSTVSLLTEKLDTSGASPASTSRFRNELVSIDERDIQSKQAPRPQQVLKPLDPVPEPKGLREQIASANTRSPLLTKQTRDQQHLPTKDDGDLKYLARKPSKSHSPPSPKRPTLETQQLNPLSSPKPAGNGAVSLRPQQVLKPLDPVPEPKGLREQRASANTRSPLLTKQTRDQQHLPTRDDGDLKYLARKPSKSHSPPSPKRPTLETQQLNPLSSPKPAGNGAVSLLTEKVDTCGVSPESTSRLPNELVSSKGERDMRFKGDPRPQQVLKPSDQVPRPKEQRAHSRSPQLTKQTRDQQDLPARDDGELEYLARKPSPMRPRETQHLNPLTSIKTGVESTSLCPLQAALIASGSPDKIDTPPSTPRRRLQNSPRPQSSPFKYAPVVNDRVWPVSALETVSWGGGRQIFCWSYQRHLAETNHV
jgi:hypothetical protein